MMITAFLVLGVLAGHNSPDRAVGCDQCGVRYSAVQATIVRLQTSPKAHDREDAAENLGKVKWTCHPEVVHALAASLLCDPKDDVREEAAESLRKMGACDPEAHLALRKAAASDRDLGVRKKSRRALASLPNRCVAGCAVCGPSPVTPTKRILADGSYIVPGSERIVDPGTPAVLEPIESTPVDRRPSIVPDELPPPPPTPVPSTRAQRIAPPVPAEPAPIIRRSSEKPVIRTAPSDDLPPLEPPSR